MGTNGYKWYTQPPAGPLYCFQKNIIGHSKQWLSGLINWKMFTKWIILDHGSFFRYSHGQVRLRRPTPWTVQETWISFGCPGTLRDKWCDGVTYTYNDYVAAGRIYFIMPRKHAIPFENAQIYWGKCVRHP